MIIPQILLQTGITIITHLTTKMSLLKKPERRIQDCRSCESQFKSNISTKRRSSRLQSNRSNIPLLTKRVSNYHKEGAYLIPRTAIATPQAKEKQAAMPTGKFFLFAQSSKLYTCLRKKRCSWKITTKKGVSQYPIQRRKESRTSEKCSRPATAAMT